MFERMTAAVQELRAIAVGLDPETLRPEDAARVVELAAEGERICQALRAKGTVQVLQTKAWARSGHRTPGEWVASRTRTSAGHGIASVQTAHRLAFMPATANAFAEGRISEQQATLVAEAANADPDAEAEMLDLAERGGVRSLRERARQVVVAATGDEDAAERVRRSRYLKDWVERDGAVRFDARLAPDDGAFVLAAVRERAAALAADAARAGKRERAEAYAADALVALARGERSTAVVHVHVDAAALDRGRLEPGEECRIDGVGAVPVAVARRLAMDAAVKALATDGADVTRVAHLGRTIPAAVRTALEARDPVCAVPACESRTNLEIDHIVPLARGGTTSLENLVRLCRYHHAMKTHRGWRIAGPPGDRRWLKPGPG